MESEPAPGIDPQRQLRAFEEAARSAEAEAHVVTPLWFWPTVALAAPMAVAIRRMDGLPRVLVVVVVAVCVSVAILEMLRRGNEAGAKAKSPAEGGRFIFWRFPAMVCFIFALQMAMLWSWDSGLAVAGATYLLSAVGTTFFWHKADEKMVELASGGARP